MGQLKKLREFANETDQTISASVEALASGRGLTLEDVGTGAGITRSAIYAKIRGESTWKAHETVALSKFFKVRLTDLYDGLGGLVGPVDPAGPLAQLEELRTFNPESPTAKIINFPLDRRRAS